MFEFGDIVETRTGTHYKCVVDHVELFMDHTCVYVWCRELGLHQTWWFYSNTLKLVTKHVKFPAK